ncbi:amino acid transporter ANT1-like protein, partial [Leptotrombidium deliense]
FIDYQSENKKEIHYPKPSFSSFFLAIGTVMFAYGATASFPTFQNDMRERRKFPIAVVIAFMILLSIYVPIASIGYKTYGDSVTENVIFTLRDGPNKIVVEVLMAGHLFFAFLLLANAPIQEIENWLKIPNGFSLKRVATRVSVLILIVFMGETVPSFGKILNLIGGSAIALLSFILPPLLYLKLCSMKSADWPDRLVSNVRSSKVNEIFIQRSISTFEKIWLFQIIVVGVIGGIACTFSALVEILSPDAFTPPCYIKPNCSFG